MRRRRKEPKDSPIRAVTPAGPQRQVSLREVMVGMLLFGLGLCLIRVAATVHLIEPWGMPGALGLLLTSWICVGAPLRELVRRFSKSEVEIEEILMWVVAVVLVTASAKAMGLYISF